MAFPIFLLCLVGLAFPCHAEDSLHVKIHQVKIAHGQAAQSQRIQDLAAVSASASIDVSSTAPSTALSILTALSVSASASSVPSATAAAVSATPFASADVSFQIYTQDLLPTDPSPPAACASALTARVACNATIQLLGSNPFYDGPSLAAMCTPTCTDSLSTYRAKVISACGNYQLPGPNDVTYAPTLAVDTISGPYAVQCRQDTNFVMRCCLRLAPPLHKGLLGYPTNKLCTPCMLGTINATLSNPLTFYPDFYAVLQSALKVCGSAFSQYNVTHPPTTTSIFSPGPLTTPIGANDTVSTTCALTGRNVTSTGTCADIASEFSVGWFDVLVNNPSIQATNCTSGIGPGTTLCLPQACTTYTPAANQTCKDIVTAANGLLASSGQSITVTQLISFNPGLEIGCAHVARQYGLSLCIRPPPGQTPPGTTSNCGGWYFVEKGDFCTQVALNNSVTLEDFLTMNPELNSECTNLWANYWYCVAPYPPLNGGAPTTTITGAVFSVTSVSLPSPSSAAPFVYPTGHPPPPPNLASGSITTGCDFYYNVASGDNCTGVETTFEVSHSDFTLWNFNPTSPCPKLTPGTAVCVMVTNATAALPPTPTNAAAGSAPSGCARWYTIVDGDGCAKLETSFNLTQSQLFALNPELAPTCTNLALKEAYCVRALPGAEPPSGPPADLNPGSWNKFNISFSDFERWNPEVSTTCSNLNLASYCVGIAGGCESIYTVVSGDSCGAIETKTSLSEAQLRALNPWLSTACSVQIGQNICTKNSHVTLPPPGPPANLNPGSWNNCTTYYNVQSGDNCNLIEAKFKIGFSDILRWNPEISATCSNLNLASYCVLGSSACTKMYTVVTNDSCGAIETKASITDAQLRAKNSWINAACTNIQVGHNLCV
ncbi:hypothetical protein B0H14DRAFT_3443508 [Mycena olivaceomarginata]|nr:hypothetical protein B0H14DRAFT_3443508 [Mycena olivaceomarginata]